MVENYSEDSIRTLDLVVIPTLWIMANSFFLDTMAVTMELIKFKIPTNAIMMLTAIPVITVDMVSDRYCSAMVALDRIGRFLS